QEEGVEYSSTKQKRRQLRLTQPTAKMWGGSPAKNTSAASRKGNIKMKMLQFAPPSRPTVTSHGPPESASAEGRTIAYRRLRVVQPLKTKRLSLGDRRLRRAEWKRKQLASIPTAKLDSLLLATNTGDE